MMFLLNGNGEEDVRVLIIEDERRLAETLAELMRENNYLADIAFDGEAGLDNALLGIYDAIILDVMLPKLSGFEVVRALRSEGSATPVLLLTARCDTLDKVTGLDCGADYYLTKPFNNSELLACVRAISRRRGEITPSELCFGCVKLDLGTRELSSGARSVQLGAKEFEVMRLLMANGKAVLPKETFILKLWGADSEAGDNNVEVYISFLRKKLLYLKADVSIGTVRKLGYRLEETA